MHAVIVVVRIPAADPKEGIHKVAQKQRVPSRHGEVLDKGRIHVASNEIHPSIHGLMRPKMAGASS